jgi:hypothetical protein
LDIFENFHLLSKDSVYQIWSNEAQLSWLNPISLDVFNKQISVYCMPYVNNEINYESGGYVFGF